MEALTLFACAVCSVKEDDLIDVLCFDARQVRPH